MKALLREVVADGLSNAGLYYDDIRELKKTESHVLWVTLLLKSILIRAIWVDS